MVFWHEIFGNLEHSTPVASLSVQIPDEILEQGCPTGGPSWSKGGPIASFTRENLFLSLSSGFCFLTFSIFSCQAHDFQVYISDVSVQT